MRSAFYLSVLFALFVLASCQREAGEILEESPPPTSLTNDSIYLKMIVYLDTISPPGLDSVDKFVFYYDDLKRLDSIDWTLFSGGATNSAIHMYEKRFYTGNDTLPYKTTSFVDPGGADAYTTVFYTYQNGVIVEDSIITDIHGSVSTTVKKFKFYGNGRTGQNYYSINGNERHLTDSLISVQTFQNGNTVLQLDTSYLSQTFHTQKTIRQFDTHPNPLKRINPPYPIITFLGFTGGDFSFLQLTNSINNEIRVQSTLDGADYEDIYENFQYRADGYPVLSRETDGEYKYRVVYIYQALP